MNFEHHSTQYFISLSYVLLGDALGLGSSRIWVVLKNQHIVGSVESTMPKRKKKSANIKPIASSVSMKG